MRAAGTGDPTGRWVGTRMVPTGEVAVVRGPQRLVAVLGSCVGVAMLDEGNRIGGICHVFAPRSPDGRRSTEYADVAVPALVEAVASAGGRPHLCRVAVAGGAELFPGAGAAIGRANAEAVVDALAAFGLRPHEQDTGGGEVTELSVEPAEGRIRIRRTVFRLLGGGIPTGSAPPGGLAFPDEAGFVRALREVDERVARRLAREGLPGDGRPPLAVRRRIDEIVLEAMQEYAAARGFGTLFVAAAYARWMEKL